MTKAASSTTEGNAADEENGLTVRPRRRFIATTDTDHDGPIFANLAKDIVPTNLNQLWVADITYIAIATGFVYLAAILDAWSRRVVGYAIGKRIDARLALAALRAAIAARRPSPGCIHHSDRGSQYAAEDYRAELDKHDLKGSMGRRGNPYDNAKAESFMKTLKVEEVYLMEYETFDDVAASCRVIEEVIMPSVATRRWNKSHKFEQEQPGMARAAICTRDRQAQIWSRKEVKLQPVIFLKCVARIQLGPEIMVSCWASFRNWLVPKYGMGRLANKMATPSRDPERHCERVLADLREFLGDDVSEVASICNQGRASRRRLEAENVVFRH